MTAAGNFIGSVFNTTGQLLSFIGKTAGNTLAALYNTTQSIVAYVGQGYNQLANNAPGVVKIILTGIGNGVSTTGKAIGSVANSTGNVISNVSKSIASTTSNLAQKTVNSIKEGIGNLAFKAGEKTQDISETVGFALVKLGYLFVNEPTKIADVQVAVLSPTSVKVSWKTNHPANGKVNYGLDRTYPFDIQSEKRVTYHEYTLTNLNPDTLYYFEVMSHNKNYVYDSNREFKTPAK